MLRNKGLCVLAVAAVIGFGFALQAMAQDSRPGGRGGWRNMTPEQRQQQMDDMRKEASKRMQESMGATDDEWKALEPKIKKVQDAAQAARSGGFGGPGGPGGGMFGGNRGNRGNRGGGPQPSPEASPNPAVKLSPVQTARADLQKVLDNKDAKAEDIKKALTTYQEARTKARDELTKAQKELREVLTQRQEAVLVLRGLLD